MGGAHTLEQRRRKQKNKWREKGLDTSLLQYLFPYSNSAGNFSPFPVVSFAVCLLLAIDFHEFDLLIKVIVSVYMPLVYLSVSLWQTSSFFFCWNKLNMIGGSGFDCINFFRMMRSFVNFVFNLLINSG